MLGKRAEWYVIIPYFLTTFLILAAIYMEERYQNVTVAVWLAYVFIPIFDYLLPLDHFNLPDDRK